MGKKSSRQQSSPEWVLGDGGSFTLEGPFIRWKQSSSSDSTMLGGLWPWTEHYSGSQGVETADCHLVMRLDLSISPSCCHRDGCLYIEVEALDHLLGFSSQGFCHFCPNWWVGEWLGEIKEKGFIHFKQRNVLLENSLESLVCVTCSVGTYVSSEMATYEPDVVGGCQISLPEPSALQVCVSCAGADLCTTTLKGTSFTG